MSHTETSSEEEAFLNELLRLHRTIRQLSFKHRFNTVTINHSIICQGLGTYRVKDVLKAKGFRWDADRKYWIFDKNSKVS